MKYLVFLAALLSIALTTERVTIKLSSTAIMSGNSIRVTCRVPRDPSNRQITGMIDLVSYDSKQLDGGANYDKVTWEFWFHKIPCEATTGACELVTNDGKTHRVQSAFVVAGCGDTGAIQ